MKTKNMRTDLHYSTQLYQEINNKRNIKLLNRLHSYKSGFLDYIWSYRLQLNLQDTFLSESSQGKKEVKTAHQ